MYISKVERQTIKLLCRSLINDHSSKSTSYKYFNSHRSLSPSVIRQFGSHQASSSLIPGYFSSHFNQSLSRCFSRIDNPTISQQEQSENINVCLKSKLELEKKRSKIQKKLFEAIKSLEKGEDDPNKLESIISGLYSELNALHAERNILADDEDLARLDCALGAVIGAFIGDSMGSAVEFQQYVSNEDLNKALAMNGGIFGNGPGQVTDDSELAMCILNGIFRTLPNWDADSIADYYKSWVMSDPFDIGITTRNSFKELQIHNQVKGLARIAKESSTKLNGSSLSNGSFMRASPLAVYCRNMDEDFLRYIVTEDSSMTHSNPVIHETETLYILCISYLIQNPKDRANAIKKLIDYSERKCSKEAQMWIRDTFNQGKAMPGCPNIGFSKIAFDHSFRELMKEVVEFDEAMKRVLLLGGDTDTNAAIVGAMIGAYVGYSSLSKEWRNKVETYEYKTKGGINRNREFLDQTKVKEMVEKIFWECP